MTARVDRLVEKVVAVTQAHHETTDADAGYGDVIIVAHGRECWPHPGACRSEPPPPIIIP